MVGIFEAGGSAAESELWCDAKVLQPAYRRGNTYQSVILRLASHDSFDQLKDALTTDPQLSVTAIREPEYYERQSQTLQTVIRTIGVAIAGLMGIGAIFGAVNTMYNAVASRSREIATLRALGFGSLPVVVSVLAEAVALSVDRRGHRRPARVGGLRRLPDVDDELPVVQPGGVRVRGHAVAAGARRCLRGRSWASPAACFRPSAPRDCRSSPRCGRL